MSLHLYSSNRLEILAEAFHRLVADDPLPPILPELVVLQSGGMARWLSMQVAQRAGICANLSFPFPNQFVDGIFRKILPEEDFQHVFDRESLKWQLMKALPSLLSESGFEDLKAYFKETSDVKRFRLAGRLADLFDQYMIFRPEMVLSWENGEGKGWQALLWRYLRTNEQYLKNVSHRAELRDRFMHALAAGGEKLLEQGRFSVFGVSSIPVFHLQILTALADHVDVHFFFMNPCREFWDDIVPGKVIDRISAEGDKDPEELYYQEGNPLLAASGRQGRELISLLHQYGDWQEHDLFYDPLDEGSVSALTIVQSDILNLRSAPSFAGNERSPADGSIQFHSCHSPMRELEVLHSRLLSMFMEDPDLQPKDILVMVPDIDFYSSLIQAVFADREGGVSIPFSIADRRLRSEGLLVRAFQDLLELRKSRLELSRVLTVLEHESVRRKFAFSRDDLERIEKWVLEVNIRWGIDSESKIEMGLPGTVDNTWRQGLDRLLLGYAVGGGGILPYISRYSAG